MVAFAGAALGCYESALPLDPTPQVPTDARFLGAWRCVGPGANEEAMSITLAASTKTSYAITWEESGEKPELYEGHVSSLKGSIIFNFRKLPAAPAAHWFFVRVVPLEANVALIQMVHEELLEGLDRGAVKRTLEQQRGNPALYEKEPLVCIRAVN